FQHLPVIRERLPHMQLCRHRCQLVRGHIGQGRHFRSRNPARQVSGVDLPNPPHSQHTKSKLAISHDFLFPFSPARFRTTSTHTAATITTPITTVGNALTSSKGSGSSGTPIPTYSYQ